MIGRMEKHIVDLFKHSALLCLSHVAVPARRRATVWLLKEHSKGMDRHGLVPKVLARQLVI